MTLPKARVSYLKGLVFLWLTACGGEVQAPEPLALEGTWEYDVQDMRYANGLICKLYFTITIQQRTSGFADLFIGFAENGRLTCQSPEGEPEEGTDLATVAINQGIYNPQTAALMFDLSTDLHHNGALEGTEIAGRVRHDDTFGWGQGEGTFRMTRTP